LKVAAESEVKALSDELALLKAGQTQSSDQISQRLKELEIEKRTLKSRVD